ncbi:hypothetical protein BC936DRAFT_146168 [Jimgerdemannia flammicorona]|uniref:Uncharacterized protein n=1 Tax=Jimgerdemannia flammicorona TaxID=994334 RepID=A0A433DNJ1_9FUNG|nr:hypothetical protein BC936DRAFT_146168 [Jimgerdemannia flammicorona]
MFCWRVFNGNPQQVIQSPTSREPLLGGGSVHVPPERAAAGYDQLALGVDGDVAQLVEVDDDAAVGAGVAVGRVAATFDDEGDMASDSELDLECEIEIVCDDEYTSPTFSRSMERYGMKSCIYGKPRQKSHRLRDILRARDLNDEPSWLDGIVGPPHNGFFVPGIGVRDDLGLERQGFLESLEGGSGDVVRVIHLTRGVNGM